MKLTTLTASLLVSLALAAPSFADMIKFTDYTPVDIDTTDYTPVDLPDYTPVDLPDHDYTPVDVNGPVNPSDAVTDAINDAVLDGEGNVIIGQSGPGAAYYVGCSVQSGGDVVIANTGSRALPATTRLKWEVRSAGDAGYVDLPRALAAGQQVRLDDATGAGNGADCVARTLNL